MDSFYQNGYLTSTCESNSFFEYYRERDSQEEITLSWKRVVGKIEKSECFKLEKHPPTRSV